MDIPVIGSGITRLQSPNLLLHLRTLWTWAALIIAAVATFSSLIRRSKRVLLRFRKVKSVIAHPSSCACSDHDDDVSCCSSSDDESDDDEETEEEEEEMSSYSEKDFGDFEELQGQNGRSDHHFTWPELARDGSVVKFWDGLGLGFDRCRESISLLDLGREEILRSFLWESDAIPAVHVASPGKVLSAGKGGVKVWDPRAAGEAPAASAVSATWQAEGFGRLVGIGGGNNEVYLGDDVGRLTVVDVRNVRSTLAETWWWGDGAVTVGTDGDGLVSWCRNAARC